MKISVKRVSKKNLENEIDDKIAEGYTLSTKTNRVAVLKKATYGGALGHGLVALFTIWWTLGLGNLVYALFRFLNNSKELHLKIGK